MTLKELHFFYKLSENPQVTQVANELNISQSAISLAIKSLENSLNEQLFDRIGKKLMLNEKGKYFKEKTLPYYLKLIDAQNIFLENKKPNLVKLGMYRLIRYFTNKFYSHQSEFFNVVIAIKFF